MPRLPDRKIKTRKEEKNQSILRNEFKLAKILFCAYNILVWEKRRQKEH